MTTFNFSGARFFKTLCGTPVCLNFRHSRFPPLNVELFFRGDDNEHAAPFHLWPDFYYCNILEGLNELVQGSLTEVHVGYFASTEHNRNLGLVPFFKETACMLYLEIEIVLVSLGPELDLLELHLHLFFLGFLEFFALLILEFAEIHDPANRRNRSW